ncbi:MAG TPA: DUF2330 domain-containing protein [Polyangiaceae bacterium]|nr:DUF2330 domain-containing protein [Polyangiaceae bacterium]
MACKPCRTWRSAALAGALSLTALLAPETALACGGFFCSSTQPVNQAAERIVFAQNSDGTVTAVIEIMYEGPSENFSWLLPISSVPMGDDIAVSSNAAFQRLQAATNPQYQLTVRVEGTCDDGGSNRGGGLAVPGSASSDNDSGSGPGGVTVEASGAVGAFEWTAISLDPALDDPAAAAVEWLEANGYDVPEGAPGLLGPYLDDGMYLLALRLQKGRDTGSIRPIVLTYDAARPMIPIKLTSVAANENMGVMTWILGDGQAVPQNYNALELNEARINWFNPSANYDQVVIAAADEAGGQGFVTEYAQPTSALAQPVWSQFDESEWETFRTSTYSPEQLYAESTWRYASFDGFWDVVQANGTLTVPLEQAQQCPDCYPVTGLDAQGFLAGLETEVIEPVRLVQRLIDEHPQITRMYTTLSADEMTVDPLFTFNDTLASVSNIHQAERVIECRSSYTQDQAPWRIELPSGGVIRGIGSNVGTWPAVFDAQPANQRVMRQGETGAGQVLEDNTGTIQQALSDYNETVPGSGDDSDGCSINGKQGAPRLAWLAVGALWWLGRRRRRQQS